ncbi:MAG: hypothetical protein KDK66_08820, partial [Deltaproteobacteria bacterium]|nr:hypothetical protein [Deltaproteobacteria bacterium]
MADEKQKALWRAEFEAYLSRVDLEEAKAGLEGLSARLSQARSLAEFLEAPKQLLFDMAQEAYFKFQGGRLKEAEAIFKGLTLFEPSIAYFHTALGTVYQKQKRYFDALVEFTLALEIEPKDVTALCNRAESFLQFPGGENLAKEDLEKLLEVDPQAKSAWAKRGKLLQNKINTLLAK